MNFDRVELDEAEVVEHEVIEENLELIENFAFEVYQQQTEISAKRYVSGVDRYVAWLELMADRASRKDYPRDPLDADSGHVYDYFSWLVNTDWGVNTRKSYFSAVQRFYRWVDQSGRGDDITESHSIDDFTLEPGELEKARQQTADDDEYLWIPREEVELLWAVENVPSPRTMWELAIKLMWYTTMRGRALCEIKIDNIDRQEGVIVIPNLKPGSDEPPFRDVVYPFERIEPLMAEWLDHGKRESLGAHVEESPYLFPSLRRPRKDGKEIKLRPSFLSKKVREAADNAGINEVESTDVRGQKRWKVTGHTIRHSAITFLANKTDVPIHLVQRQAGHSKIETTLSYVHDDDEEFRRRFRMAWD